MGARTEVVVAHFAGTLQPGVGTGTGAEAGHAYLAAEPGAVGWGRLPRGGDAPVVQVEGGQSLTIDTLSHEGLLADQGGDPAAFFARCGVERERVLDDAVALCVARSQAEGDGPHVVTGPIAVRGARPGDLLAMTLEEASPRVDYGVISNRHGRGALPGELPAAGAGAVSVFTPIAPGVGGEWRGWLPTVEGQPPLVSFPLAPFLGIMGVATATEERAHSVPPGAHGGNIDLKHLTEGATLYVPVQVADALAYVGDPHFAQGNGEVALTALEASLRARVRFDVVPADEAARAFGELAGPVAEDATHLMPMGMDADLDEAMRACVRQAIAILGARYGMQPHLAYAYLSAATDFEITQVVDLVTGVHARIRVADFGAVRRG